MTSVGLQSGGCRVLHGVPGLLIKLVKPTIKIRILTVLPALQSSKEHVFLHANSV